MNGRPGVLEMSFWEASSHVFFLFTGAWLRTDMLPLKQFGREGHLGGHDIRKALRRWPTH